MTAAAIDPTLLKTFESDGYVILRGIISPAVVEGVRAELRLVVDDHAGRLLQQGKITDPLVDEPFDKRLARLYASCMDIAPMSIRGDALHRSGFFPLLFNPRLLDIVESILGPEIRLYPNYTVRPKFPDDAKTQVLWHQDAAYTEQMKTAEGVQDLRMVNVWSPLVPATRQNGCMQFIPATHRLGLVEHVQKEYYLEIAPAALEPHLPHAIDVELVPGDVVLFSNLLFHVGQPNRSDHIRWSIDWRYQDATQPTLRPSQGHLARSRSNPAAVVKDARHWINLKAEFV